MTETVPDECPFCAIVRGEASAWLVDEDEATMAFLDLGQATAGHTLVVPRRHASDLGGLSEDEAAAVMRSVHRVAARLRDTLRPDGLTVVQSNGAAAGQEVLHFHVHVVPRYRGDGLVAPWPSSGAAPAAQLAEVHRRISGDQ
jgi:histidine triad (HIT) family protein